jgi:hypothetical protein
MAGIFALFHQNVMQQRVETSVACGDRWPVERAARPWKFPSSFRPVCGESAVAVQARVFTPEHLGVVQRAIERVRSQRKFPPHGAEAERLALKAIAKFSIGYSREASLSRALRQDG